MKHRFEASIRFLAGAFCSAMLLTTAPADEVYDTLTINQQVCTNVHVVKVNAAEVVVTFDGGGAALQRQELPEPLKSKYPYDPAAAAAFERERALKARAQSEQARAGTYNNLLYQEKSIQAAIAKTQGDLVELQKEINIRARQAKGRRANHPARLALDQAREQKLELERQVASLKKQLELNRASQERFR
jgi:hypothetical protein